MNFTISIFADKNYYKESYEEILKSNPPKNYEDILGVLLIVFGIVLLFKDTNQAIGIFPYFFIGAGIYEFVKFHYSKYKWMKEMSKSKLINVKTQFEFDEEKISHTGSYSKGEIAWKALKSIKKTKKGLILRLENKNCIYIPLKNFDNQQQIEYLLNKKLQ